MPFYDNYVKLCNSVGKTPSAAAIEAGLSKSLVSRWKRDGGATDASIAKIADYFGVTVDELMADSGEKEKPTGNEADGLDNELVQLLMQLTPEEEAKAISFIQGMIAGRR